MCFDVEKGIGKSRTLPMRLLRRMAYWSFPLYGDESVSAPAYPQVTDQKLLGILQDVLLEVNNNGASMTTGQFTLQQLLNALNQASYEFQRDVGLVAEHIGFQGDTLNGLPVTPGQEQVQLPQDCMDVRRRAWISFAP